ncbi:unnamed protein product [Didymodactylos carnosus]|uniref:Uncharacterized protein n=1 Tax=Didymodactylos carnosus TaxID=1234261 RepID=A0A814T7S2_9BILA|nr:unnamed protein product [Didymodactylos carnosus]CAF1158147.1 unnamed protein product [Didymodactylos carnosus]CAF3900578.1 unnamed protein product [Didymodactylos carnosus]CAF3921555.1 unnamed protein product [Didymodactylos carnosus]
MDQAYIPGQNNTSALLYSDYIYLVYLFILSIFYAYYMALLLHDAAKQINDNELINEDYDRIPKLFWIRRTST